jgi:hypothetical protein
MMDFLRRLAPPREGDPSRAVAVLPSRFARESPLRATLGQVRPAQRADEAEVPPTLDATSASAAIPAFTVQRVAVTGMRLSQAVPQPPDSEMPRVDTGKAISSTDMPAYTRDIEVPEARAVRQDRHGENSERAQPARPEPQRAAVTRSAGHGIQDVASPPAQPRPGVAPLPAQPHVVVPLSQAVLNQRTLRSRDDTQVVHVTIGRIDVVANAAPAPAVRRSPAPRRATVTLTDYLRGGGGSRR